jgi:wyosine [tRNA(Phe)-imidazoG37] synthetase (radical SAM superfamily)
MHPEFSGIIDDTIETRNKFFPNTKIAVLSNSTMLHKEEVFEALNKIEDNILKLDSVLDSRIQQINAPNIPSFTFEKVLNQLCRFDGNLIIQTMFLKGEIDGKSVTNTTEEEIIGWIEALKQIKPKQVMIYTIDRETPIKNLQKVTKEELEMIANRARQEGFNVTVSA